MQAYICTICGFLYDDESAERSPEGKLIIFQDLDFEWVCPG
jgi:rubredoxin